MDSDRVQPTTPDPNPAKRRRFLNRRRVLTYGAFLGGAAAVGLYAWRIEPHWVEVVRRDLPIAGLPKALMGRSLIQLSDIHIGPDVDSDYIAAQFALVSSLRPDILVFTGDFLTASEGLPLDEMTRLLRRIDRPPLGMFAILGNHEYGYYWSEAKVGDTVAKRLRELGLKVLRNEHCLVEGLQIVGLDDLWGPNFDAPKAFAVVNWSGPTLTLCHNPDAVDRDDFRPCRGWVLSGHTHGGQCKPPFLPPPLLPVKNKRYTAGEFDIGEGRRLYINRGLGHLLRVRFNVRPEITVFRLVSDPTA